MNFVYIPNLDEIQRINMDLVTNYYPLNNCMVGSGGTSYSIRLHFQDASSIGLRAATKKQRDELLELLDAAIEVKTIGREG